MVTLRRRYLLAATLVLLGVLSLYSIHRLHKKYRSRIEKCQRQRMPNVTCSLFPRHPRRSAYKELFRRWTEFAEKHNVSYALACGSLLGQHRNEDMIPWDTDIDVYVDIKHYHHLKRLGHPRNFRANLDDVYRLIVQPDFDVRRERDPRRWNCVGLEVEKLVDLCSFSGLMARFAQRNVGLDVFAIETLNDVVYDDEHSISYNYSYIHPFVHCKFMGIQTKCLNNSKAVLEKYYGSLKPLCKCVEGKWIPDWNLPQNQIY